MKKLLAFICSGFIFSSVILPGCKGKKYIHKDDLIGVYKIEDYISIDTTAKTIARIKKAVTWTLTLEANDNFEFNGHGVNFPGYWALKEINGKTNNILFQSGYMKEDIIYAQCDEKKLLFNKPVSMLDSLFQQVILKRIDQ
jgi:hypothetical protein